MQLGLRIQLLLQVCGCRLCVCQRTRQLAHARIQPADVCGFVCARWVAQGDTEAACEDCLHQAKQSSYSGMQCIAVLPGIVTGAQTHRAAVIRASCASPAARLALRAAAPASRCRAAAISSPSSAAASARACEQQVGVQGAAEAQLEAACALPSYLPFSCSTPWSLCSCCCCLRGNPCVSISLSCSPPSPACLPACPLIL